MCSLLVSFLYFILSYLTCQVLIKVLTVGINYSDSNLRSGHSGSSCELSSIPGSDCAGVVVRVGSKVTKVKVCESSPYFYWFDGLFRVFFKMCNMHTSFHLN